MSVALKLLPPPAGEPVAQVQQVLLSEILRSPFNRDRTAEFQTPGWLEFVGSIKQHGILQPLIGRPLPNAFDPERKPGTPRIELVIGEGRWLGAEQAGLPTVPVIVRQLSDREALEQQAEENDKRKDLNALQSAEKYQQLLEQYGKDGLNKEAAMAELCRKLHKGKSTIYEALGLLKLAPQVKELVASNRLPASHAGQLAKLNDLPAEQVRLLAVIAPTADPDSDEVRELENAFGLDMDATRDAAGLLSFRDTKDLVAAVDATRKNRQKWAKRVEEWHKLGRKWLIPEECAKVMPLRHKYVDQNSGYVQLAHWCGELQAYYKQMGKHAPDPVLVHSIDYSVIAEVYPRKEAIEALKAAGVDAPAAGGGSARGNGSSDTAAAAASRAAAAKTRQKTAERRAVVSAIVEKALTTPTKIVDFLPFVLGALHQRALSDTIREMFNRRGLDRKDYQPKKGSYGSPHNVWIKQAIEKASTAGEQMALIVDFAIAMDLSAWGGQGTGEKLLTQAARMLQVDPRKVVAQPAPVGVAKAHWTRKPEGDFRFNAHGVCTSPASLVLPFPKASKISIILQVARVTGGWVTGHNFSVGTSGSSGLPKRSKSGAGEASLKPIATVREALQHEAATAREMLKECKVSAASIALLAAHIAAIGTMEINEGRGLMITKATPAPAKKQTRAKPSAETRAKIAAALKQTKAKVRTSGKAKKK